MQIYIYIRELYILKRSLWDNIYKEPYIHKRSIAYTYI